jgi:hypothetical protein
MPWNRVLLHAAPDPSAIIIENIERGGILELIGMVFLDKSFVEVQGHGESAGCECVVAGSVKFQQTFGLVCSK